MQRLFVLFHSPGPAWDRALGFLEQPVASGLLRVAVRPWTVPMGFAVGALPSHEER